MRSKNINILSSPNSQHIIVFLSVCSFMAPVVLLPGSKDNIEISRQGHLSHGPSPPSLLSGERERHRPVLRFMTNCVLGVCRQTGGPP